MNITDIKNLQILHACDNSFHSLTHKSQLTVHSENHGLNPSVYFMCDKCGFMIEIKASKNTVIDEFTENFLEQLQEYHEKKQKEKKL